MTEISAELVSRLVTGRKRDGRCTYDPQAKAEVVEACLEPGVSVAKIGLQCGINANLLRRWIGERQRAGMARPAVAAMRQIADAAFVPLQLKSATVQSVPVPVPVRVGTLQLRVRLANGVAFDLVEVEIDSVSTIIEQLNSLSCSSSTAR